MHNPSKAWTLFDEDEDRANLPEENLNYKCVKPAEIEIKKFSQKNKLSLSPIDQCLVAWWINWIEKKEDNQIL